jgi:hypothetical protein
MFIIQVFLGCDILFGQLDPEDRETLFFRNANNNLIAENTFNFHRHCSGNLRPRISSMFIYVCKFNFFLCCVSWNSVENLTFLPFRR